MEPVASGFHSVATELILSWALQTSATAAASIADGRSMRSLLSVDEGAVNN